MGPGMHPQSLSSKRKAWTEKNKPLLAASLASGRDPAGEAGKVPKMCPLWRCFAGRWRLRLLGAHQEPTTDPRNATE